MRAGWRRAGRLISAAGAVLVSAALLGLMGFGYRTIPALGPALDPGRGAWTSAAGGTPVTSQALRVPGLTGPVTVSYTKDGLASISASDTSDLFLALGYVHARFRLSEMDLERRLGEGTLSQLGGPSDVTSDEFELRLGLLRTARNEWGNITADPGQAAARQALTAYARGVNDDIAQVRASGNWPAIYPLTGAYPRPWTPVDSLVIQGVLTQELDFTTSPLDRAILTRGIGARNAGAWLPAVPANAGVPSTATPYDAGPYLREPLTPVAADVASSVPAGTSAATTGAVAAPASGATQGTERSAASKGVAQAAGQLLAEVSQLGFDQVHQTPDSNAWAVNGPAVTGGGALLGGDPHLPQTLPSIWYEVALSAPGYQAAGATVPGVPGVLLGHNAHIAWSLTDTQDQGAFYYAEKVRGDEYYWDGAWRPMTVEHYTIPVRGAPARHLTVDITVHGPIMTQLGQTMAVDWMGNVPSDDLSALLAVNEAANFTQFKAALQGWRAPTQNFTYADSDPVAGSAGPAGASGNIGVYAAGYYPQVASGCQPWLPMPGTGACDITGIIPYNAIPQVYDPPSHVVATDNQRPVTAAYPYYVGTSDDFYDPGYRAGYAYQALGALTTSGSVSAGSVEALQNSVTDSLAASIVPRLRAVLAASGSSLTPMQRQAAALLGSWNYQMSASSAAATVWWQFWSQYLSQVFQPWWTAGHVHANVDPASLEVGPGLAPLDEDLQAWTLASTPSVTAVADAAVRGPRGKGPPDIPAAMVAAFKKAVEQLAKPLGDTPSGWTWGRVHFREFPSVAGASGLGYGPRSAGSDPFAEDAADGGRDAEAGPSWRMVATLSVTSGVSAVGVYPGGQSENPASPWYDNLVSLWWNGQYLPMPAPGSAGDDAKWALHG
ncbi:MAG TPA: penicillin acylase family protein [Trebonia sp.]|nr:penicillin acylase family protein [Trebonia sp.]